MPIAREIFLTPVFILFSFSSVRIRYLKNGNQDIIIVLPRALEGGLFNMSSLAHRRDTMVTGSKRWWRGGCWATRSHQEAYLRKLYSRKNFSAKDGVENNGAPWVPVVYDLPTTDEHYLDAFLRNRNEGNVDCPALSTPRASPTEKCLDFLGRESRTTNHHGRVFGNVKKLPDTMEVTEHNLDSILHARIHHGDE